MDTLCSQLPVDLSGDHRRIRGARLVSSLDATWRGSNRTVLDCRDCLCDLRGDTREGWYAFKHFVELGSLLFSLRQPHYSSDQAWLIELLFFSLFTSSCLRRRSQ